ncbi:MAG TPA: hypothetical protein VFT06_01735, partial [Flavisolibacter sp.]|nr:hypothetical protein [Flavisolibacter sp.]
MGTAETKSSILDKEAARRKIKRMALEVAEQNTDESELIIAGIVGNGEVVARSVAAELKKLVPLTVTVTTIQLNKKNLDEVS